MLGEEDPSVKQHVSMLASMARKLERQYGPDSPNTVECKFFYGEALMVVEKKYSDALPHLLRGFDFAELITPSVYAPGEATIVFGDSLAHCIRLLTNTSRNDTTEGKRNTSPAIDLQDASFNNTLAKAAAVVETREKQYGPNNEKTLQAVYTHGILLLALERYSEALPLLRHTFYSAKPWSWSEPNADGTKRKRKPYDEVASIVGAELGRCLILLKDFEGAKDMLTPLLANTKQNVPNQIFADDLADLLAEATKQLALDLLAKATTVDD